MGGGRRNNYDSNIISSFYFLFFFCSWGTKVPHHHEVTKISNLKMKFQI